ncbi:MAG: glycosyltransferase [Eubacteriales bacterium]|nr:glycosyltransferase [Eubacteriales bacterium]
MQPYSVLMAVYQGDHPEHLGISIDSILAQTVPTDDFIIVADGPLTAAQQNLIAEKSASYANIHLVQLPDNVGLGLALNAGLAVCKHELVARMDADDIAYPYRMDLQLQAFAAKPELDLVGGYVSEFYDDSDRITAIKEVPLDQAAIYAYGKRRNPFIHPTVMFKKSRIMSLGGYSALRRGQDYELFIRILASGCQVANIGQPLLKFRSSQNMYQRRKSWLSTSLYIRNVYQSWRLGYAGINDLCMAVFMRLSLYLMPLWLSKIIYRKVMRKSVSGGK